MAVNYENLNNNDMNIKKIDFNIQIGIVVK